VIWLKTILVHGPTIVDAARKLYAATRRTADPEAAAPEGGGLDALRHAVNSLAAREMEHSALLADLAKQVQDIATTVDALRVRVTLALLGSALALALALVAVALRVWG
jgi:hypothetical protein